jgi:hypothetical protein
MCKVTKEEAVTGDTFIKTSWRDTSKIPLYVIKQKGRDLYWCCSAAHGCGWTSPPKQAFSRSEVRKELQFLIEKNWFTPVDIIQLSIAGTVKKVEKIDGPNSQAKSSYNI